jgi:hypothetical protein
MLSGVGCGRPPEIVLGLQSVDRYHDIQMWQCRPASRKGTKGAGHNLHVDSTIEQKRDQDLQFAIPNQRIASDDRQMQGPQAVDYLKHTIGEFLSLAIVQAAQCYAASEMSVINGATANTVYISIE